jgi:hypothetical protein
VANVFHTVPHPSKNGSGVSVQSQHQRLDADGRQRQRGQRIPLNLSRGPGRSTFTVTGLNAPVSFKRHCTDMGGGTPTESP